MPVGIAIDGANRNDMKMLEATIESVPIDRPQARPYWLQNLCLDKGYDRPVIARMARGLGFTPHIRARGEEAREIRHNPRFKARRWIVERTHSWFNRFRRILIRWEKRAHNYLAVLHFASAIIALRVAGILG